MEDIIKVEYKYKNDIHGDFVCSLTRFMDKYLLSNTNLFYTYIYNDLAIFSNKDELQIAFRVPGATRGSIVLKRLNQYQFRIKTFRFNESVCFGEFKCYDDKLKEDIKEFEGSILDFSEVKLINNKKVDIYE